MKDRQFYCDHHREVGGKARALKIHLTDGICDVYGCPNYTKDSYRSTPQTSRVGPSSSKHHRKSVSRHFFDALAKSSINGISNTFAAGSWWGRITWLLMFVFCVTGFSYQASHFYDLYRSKPSVVQIEVENDGEVDFPAVTVCNKNRIRRSAYCRHFEEKCGKGKENLTLSEPQINDLLYDLLLDGRTDIRRDLGHNQSMFEECDFIGTPVAQGEECMRIWEYFYDPDYGNCFTFSALKKLEGGGEEVALQARKVDFWQEENDLTIVLDIEPEEVMERRRYPGIVLVIHDEKALPDLHTEGLHFFAGSSYTVTVAKSTVILLPPPYKTNCTDYSSLPWANIHKRRLTSRVCTVGCSQHFQLKKCNYVTENISLFYNELPYTRDDRTEAKVECALKEEKRTVDYCRSICGLPCRDTAFNVAVSESDLTGTEVGEDLTHRDNNPITDDIVKVKIFYSTLEHKIYRHIPKYDTMELFSFLGGYSGVWLGFSLLTVYELLDIVCSTLLFALTKFRRRRRNRRLVNSSTIHSRKQKRHYYYGR